MSSRQHVNESIVFYGSFFVRNYFARLEKLILAIQTQMSSSFSTHVIFRCSVIIWKSRCRIPDPISDQPERKANYNCFKFIAIMKSRGIEWSLILMTDLVL